MTLPGAQVLAPISRLLLGAAPSCICTLEAAAAYRIIFFLLKSFKKL